MSIIRTGSLICWSGIYAIASLPAHFLLAQKVMLSTRPVITLVLIDCHGLHEHVREVA